MWDEYINMELMGSSSLLYLNVLPGIQTQALKMHVEW